MCEILSFYLEIKIDRIPRHLHSEIGSMRVKFNLCSVGVACRDCHICISLSVLDVACHHQYWSILSNMSLETCARLVHYLQAISKQSADILLCHNGEKYL